MQSPFLFIAMLGFAEVLLFQGPHIVSTGAMGCAQSSYIGHHTTLRINNSEVLEGCVTSPTPPPFHLSRISGPLFKLVRFAAWLVVAFPCSCESFMIGSDIYTSDIFFSFLSYFFSNCIRSVDLRVL